MKNEFPYHPKATQAWIDKVTEKVTDKIIADITSEERHNPEYQSFSEEELELLNNNRSFLQRIAKGFIVEFLRQTADKIPELNPTNDPALKASFIAEEKRTIDREKPPGVFHATAGADWLAKRGMRSNIAVQTVGIIIRHSIDVFIKEYTRIDKSNPPHASIHRDVRNLLASLEKIAKNRDSTHSI